MTKAKVSLAEIRSWFDQTFDLLEQAGCTEFELEPNHYWQVFFSDAFDYGQPIDERHKPTPVIGTLTDDLDELRKELERAATEDGALAWHLLSHLASFVPLMASQTQVLVLSKEESP